MFQDLACYLSYDAFPDSTTSTQNTSAFVLFVPLFPLVSELAESKDPLCSSPAPNKNNSSS